MRVAERTITAIGQIVTGDKQLSPYRTGPMLVRLFNRFGANDVYGQGFPSRWFYTEEKLRFLNGTPALAELLREVLDPREFIDLDQSPEAACEYLNKFLGPDGYEVLLHESRVKVRSLDASSVEFRHPFSGSAEEAHLFIDEQLAKCEEKVRDGDFDGAVTNARSLLEAVLLEIERQLEQAPRRYDGDLPKLYKRVQKALDLDPSRPGVDSTVRQLRTGLVSVVNGIAGISNQMGDRHARTYAPAKRHATLAVNAAKTVANFLLDTWSAATSRSSHGPNCSER